MGYGRQLGNRLTTQLKLKVRTSKADVLETVIDGCVTSTLGPEHYNKLRTVHHHLLLPTIGCSRGQLFEVVQSYSKTLNKT